MVENLSWHNVLDVCLTLAIRCMSNLGYWTPDY